MRKIERMCPVARDRIRKLYQALPRGPTGKIRHGEAVRLADALKIGVSYLHHIGK